MYRLGLSVCGVLLTVGGWGSLVGLWCVLVCLGEGLGGDDAGVGDEDSASDVFCVEGGDECVVGGGFVPEVADADGGFWGCL